MPSMLHKFGLEFNPFEPSAAGPPLKGVLSPPTALAEQTRAILDAYQTGRGTKALIVTGEYGSGKTCLLRWLHTDVLPNRRIKSFYFDNPGVQFYDLANALLRTIGRKDFAKFIWELAGGLVSAPYTPNMFQSGFEAYVTDQSKRRQPDRLTQPLQEAIRAASITTDDEIAHCLARIVTDAVRKPYFEYRDFVPRQKGSLVPEAEEAPYFRAILKTISKGTNAQAVAFLIDEFEEIGLQKRLTRRASHDYLATLKRLIRLSESSDLEFWIMLSMTPDSYETTVEMAPALAEGFAKPISIKRLSRKDAAALIGSRLSAARSASANRANVKLSPFPDDIGFRPTTYSNPRRLVKTCFYAISDATDETPVPFPDSYLQGIEEKYYPSFHGSRIDRHE